MALSKRSIYSFYITTILEYMESLFFSQIILNKSNIEYAESSQNLVVVECLGRFKKPQEGL